MARSSFGGVTRSSAVKSSTCMSHTSLPRLFRDWNNHWPRPHRVDVSRTPPRSELHERGWLGDSAVVYFSHFNPLGNLATG